MRKKFRVPHVQSKQVASGELVQCAVSYLGAANAITEAGTSSVPAANIPCVSASTERYLVVVLGAECLRFLP